MAIILLVNYRNRIQESGARIQLGILCDWWIAQRKAFSSLSETLTRMRGCANGMAVLILIPVSGSGAFSPFSRRFSLQCNTV
ncbi:hypothetical protein FD724_10765 [Nostoc sp. C057]|uniref:hypothetical protein n=1 Tax=Nostoc sp. C057 TaxID=2576903 RepID=UPI0015C2E5C8|nr:hypothetical protein [Nostoc sp. C057]QLE48546.1 hypothetical protein FD724_10765 [Nostoc sp. C057]